MTMVDVTVRGGGIFGLLVAWACLKRGASVRLVESRAIGAGSSGGLVGALAPHVPENWNDKKAFQFDSLRMAGRQRAAAAESACRMTLPACASRCAASQVSSESSCSSSCHTYRPQPLLRSRTCNLAFEAYKQGGFYRNSLALKRAGHTMTSTDLVCHGGKGVRIGSHRVTKQLQECLPKVIVRPVFDQQ